MPQPQSPRLNNPILPDFFRITGVSVLLFLVTAFFTLLLSASMLSDLSRQSRLSGYAGLVEQVQRSVERGLRFGRPLDGYAGLDEQLQGLVFLAGESSRAAVIDAAGAVIRESVGFDAGAVNSHMVEPGWTVTDATHRLAVPLRGRMGVQEGMLLFEADNAVIDKGYHEYLRHNIILILIIAFALALVQSGWIYHALWSDGQAGRLRRNLSLILLLFAGCGQVAYCVPSAMQFSRVLASADQAKGDMTGRILAYNLERLAGKGVELGRVGGISTHLRDLVAAAPETAAIQVYENGVLVAEAGEPAPGGEEISVPVRTYTDGTPLPGRQAAEIRVLTDPAELHASIRRVCLNMGTSSVISCLLLVELIQLFLAYGRGLRRHRHPDPLDGTADTDSDKLVVSVRLLAFLFFFGYDMVLSFVPLAAAALPGSIWPFPESLAGALPITTEQIMGSIGILTVGRIFARHGLRRCVFLGLASAVAGSLLGRIAPTIMVFILSRALSGFGFGVLFMGCQLGLMARQVRAGGLAQMYSGTFSGSLCGVAAGAMASEFFGYQNVFGFAVIFLVAGMFLARSLPGPLPVGTVEQPRAEPETGTRRRYFLSAEFISPLALVTIPVAMSMAGFLYLSVPTELNRLGIGQSDIGRLFMGYSLCFILFGPLFAKIADSGGKYFRWVALAGIANGLAILVAVRYQSYGGYAVAVLLEGMSHTLLSASAMVCVLHGRRAQGMDRSVVGSTYRLVERGGHVVGPLLFGLLLSAAGMGHGAAVMGALFLAGGTAFILVGGILYGKPRD